MGAQQGKDSKDAKTNAKAKPSSKAREIRTVHSGNIFTEHNGNYVSLINIKNNYYSIYSVSKGAESHNSY